MTDARPPFSADDLQRPWPSASGPTDRDDLGVTGRDTARALDLTDSANRPSLTETAADEHGLGAAPRLEAGTALGRHRIRRLLGTGGAGQVYAAYDTELRREVAVKVLHHESFGGDDSMGQQRLLREARAMASLSHPNVAQVLEVRTFGGRIAIVMELLDGGTLTRWISARRRGYEEILAMFDGAGRGLAHAHAAGIVHRDFKPDNVLLGSDGRPRVTDFGLARDSGPPEGSPGASSSQLRPLSGHSSWLGTPAYMAPEQHLGRNVDTAADQFAFAVALYEALYRERPFPGQSLAELSIAVTSGRLRDPPRDAPVPPRIWGALRRALQTDPADRWPSMIALLAALSRRGGRTPWLVAGVGAMVGLAAWFTRPSSAPDPCTEAVAIVDAAWSQARRTSLAPALAESALAPADHHRLLAHLDGWRAQWSTAYLDACRLAQREDSRDADVRLRCLQAQPPIVATLVDALAEGDAAVLARVDDIVAALPTVPACADARRLERGAPVPDDPRERDEVTEIRQDIGRVLALEKAGRLPDALALARACHTRATEVGFAPLTAQADHALGVLLERTGDYDESARHLLDAEHEARAHDLDEIAIEAGIELSYVIGYRQSKPEEGLQWVRTTRAAIERAGGDSDADVRLFINEATIHEREGDYQAAFDGFDAARRRLEKEGSALRLAAALINMGLMLNRLGRAAEAIAPLERALASLTRARGEEHPLVAAALNNLGMAHEDLGDYPRANEYYRSALTIRESLYGPDHPQVAVALNNVALMEQRAGNLPAARALVERGLRIREEAFGPEHPRVAFSLELLAALRREVGELDEAIRLHQRARTIYETSMGPEHPEVATSLAGLGTTLMRKGDLDGAERSYRRALKIREAAFDASHRAVATSRLRLGEVLAARGRRDEAMQYFDLARPVLSAQLPVDHADRLAVEAGPQPPQETP